MAPSPKTIPWMGRYSTELKGGGCLQSSGHVLETKVSISAFTNWKILWHSLFKEEFIQVICILVTFSCIHRIKFSCILWVYSLCIFRICSLLWMFPSHLFPAHSPFPFSLSKAVPGAIRHGRSLLRCIMGVTILLIMLLAVDSRVRNPKQRKH
jgi:hypothetical protein